jgi:hypothetical protein
LPTQTLLYISVRHIFISFTASQRYQTQWEYYIRSPSKLREIVPPPSQNTVGVCNLITFLILYYVSSRLVTFLKVNDAHISTPRICYHIVSYKFLNFSFQVCVLFVPEMSASITSYIVQIIYITLGWILYSLDFSLPPLIYVGQVAQSV